MVEYLIITPINDGVICSREKCNWGVLTYNGYFIFVIQSSETFINHKENPFDEFRSST